METLEVSCPMTSKKLELSSLVIQGTLGTRLLITLPSMKHFHWEIWLSTQLTKAGRINSTTLSVIM